MKNVRQRFFTILLLMGIVVSFSACEDLLDTIVVPEEANGQVVFWSNFYGAPVSVWVDNVYKGDITAVNYYAPTCNTSGCVTLSLSAGTYAYYAADGTYSWSGTITVGSNACGTMLLTL